MIEQQKDLSLGALIPEFIIYIQDIRGLSPNSVTGYSEDLKKLQTYIQKDTLVSSVTTQQIMLCIGEMNYTNYAVTSINRFIVVCRTFFSYCKKNKYIDFNPVSEIKSLKAPKKLPKYMSQQEIDNLCNCTSKNILWGTRDRAIFEMFYSSGCRLSELYQLKFSDFVNGFNSAVVHGKGSKDRIVYFEKDAIEALKKYIVERKNRFPESFNKGNPLRNCIFLSQKGKVLSKNGIEYIIRRYSGFEGVNNPISAHAFRHTFATLMLNNGADVRMVQEMLGHASISTTQKYTHVSQAQLKKSYLQAHPHSGKDD